MTAQATALDDLIACPHCDAIYKATAPRPGERAVCHRCHTVLIAPRKGAGLKIIALALASVILVIGALTFPFIGIRRLGLSSDATVLDAAMAFSGPLMVLSLGVFALIIFLPLTRLLLTIYVLTPVVFDRPAWPGAKRAFRMSETLRPWSMAEIFVIGCAVALIKLSDLARVELGPAFWMFVILVVLIVVQDTFMCRWSVWKSLDR
jgi:paraquat-inducible protein A